jgi:hypothetical protein
MNGLIKLGLAAAFVLGGSTAGFALDAKVGGNAKAGAEVGTDAGAAVDATTTASVGGKANYGSLISGLQTGASADFSTFTETSTLDCVVVSSLKGDAQGDAQAFANARTKNADAIATLQGNIQASAALWTKIQSTCGPDVALEDVVLVESDGSGGFIVYIDDAA